MTKLFKRPKFEVPPRQDVPVANASDEAQRIAAERARRCGGFERQTAWFSNCIPPFRAMTILRAIGLG